ncbi:uncharacterized protein CDAR_558361 [Caerostris darwini]|uniref:Uncharacterized protein n=2 Tax=Caerostris TaxID=172845 RepID=A0AAV4UQ24_9ARAC|nr:uncharacterized protein CEXT_260361 [Caerostris extrusa]GIY59535.1 uncharacterized protein CDAR_558361 [Caerostris darwini]
MVNQMLQSDEGTVVQGTESIGEAAIILISIGSVLVILCAASIIYGLRRRRHILSSMGGAPSIAEDGIQSPTDFMNSLASWDRCHSIDEMLEKRRRSVWTLEILDSYGSNEEKTERPFNSDS